MKTPIAALSLTLFLIALAQHALGGDPIRPDAALTPGVRITVPIEKLVVPGYANRIGGGVRNVPESEKKAVFSEYHIVPSGNYEIDHLISLELGGANDIKNLWPQSYLTRPWNAHVKDKLEDWMAASVRHTFKDKGAAAATTLLNQYQAEIAHDWIAAYSKYLGTP
jgi:hypothetical protein